MNSTRTISAALTTLAILASCGCDSARAQSATSPEELSLAAVEARITSLEANRDLDEALKARLLESYRKAAAQLKVAQAHDAEYASFQKIVETGPAELRSLEEAARQPLPERSQLESTLGEESLKDLQARLTRAEAELATLQSDLQAQDQEIARQKTRPQEAREEITQARTELEQVDAELSAPAPDPTSSDPSDAAAARRALLQARRLARSGELRKLEQELVVYEMRLSLLKAEREKLARRQRELQLRLDVLRGQVGEKRRAVAARAQVEAEQARQAAEDKHPALLALAEQSRRFSNDLAELTQLTEVTESALGVANEELQALRADHKSAEQKLEKVGLTGVLGEILLESRRKLPDLSRYRERHAGRLDEISVLRLREIEAEERARWLADRESAVAEVIDEARPPLEDDEIEPFREELETLLDDQAGLLNKLEDTYARYLRKLGDLDAREEELLDGYREYAAFLDDHLFWTPSATPLSWKTLATVPDTLRWLTQPTAWRDVAETGWRQARRHGVLSSLLVLVVLLLLGARGRLLRGLRQLGQRVRQRRSDRFLLTLIGLALTALIAAPVPLLMAYTSWLLASSYTAVPLARAAGHGLWSVATLLFALTALWRLCEREGVADAHLRWSDSALGALRQNIPWLVALGLPLLFVTSTTEAADTDVHAVGLGRLTFVASMVLLAVFAARVLRFRGGLLERALALEPDRYLARLRHLWYGAAVLTPLAVGTLAVCGYVYTARALEQRVIATLWIVFGGVLVYHLVVRSLVIARRKLAFERARERRDAQEAQVRSGSLSGDDLAVPVDEPEIDMATIRRQTHGLFRTAALFAVLISLTTVWADVLPALGVLDRELWHSTTTIGGQETLRPITIGRVILAIALTLFAFIAARNLPGLLEISAVRRLPLEPGSRYAVSAIGQYCVVAIGLVAAFYTIGVGWSHVQWLVAALSVGLGFGLQEIFANFVSGLIILLERPIRVGDTVTIGQISGTVTRIRIRATTITDWDQKELVVPNKSFITDQLVNWSLSNPVTRLVVRVGIAYGSDTDLALRLMLRAARSNPKVLDEPESEVFFVGFGESSLDFEVRAFVKELSNRGRTRIVHELHLAIDRAFRENGVVIAFPQLDLHVKNGAPARDDLLNPPQDFSAPTP